MGIFLASAGALRLLACLPSRRWRACFPCRPSKSEHAESKDLGVEPRSLRSDQVLSKWRASKARSAPSPLRGQGCAEGWLLRERRIEAWLCRESREPRSSPQPSPPGGREREREEGGFDKSLGLLDLPEFELDRRGAAEDQHGHAQAALLVVHFLDDAVEVVERALGD